MDRDQRGRLPALKEGATVTTGLAGIPHVLLAQARMGIWRWDASKDEVWWSPAIFEMLGCDPDLPPPPLSKHQELMTKESFDEFEVAVRRCLETGESYRLRLQFKRASGDFLHMESHGMPTRSADGKISGLCGVIMDRSEEHKSREDLLRQQEFLWQTNRLAKVGGWRLDCKTCDVEWTDEVYRIHGVDNHFKPTLESTIAFYEDPARDELQAVLQQSIDEGLPFKVELPIRNARHERRWVAAFGEPRFEDGICCRLTGAVQDITDRRANDLRLAEERLLFKSLLEHSFAGFWDWHIADGYTELSPAFERMFGYATGELGQDPDAWKRIIHPEDLSRTLTAFARHKESHGRVPFDLEVRYRHKAGNIIWVVCRGSVIEWDEHGNPERMLGCHIDITDRKEAELGLLESRERLQRVLRGANDGWWEWDLLTSEAYYSPRWWEMLGYEPDALPPEPGLWLQFVHADDRASASKRLEEVVAGREFYIELEVRLAHKDGHFLPVLSRGFITRSDDGTALFISGTDRDLTDRYLAELARKEAEQERVLAALDERVRLSQFMHDGVGQLLTAMTMKAQRLAEDVSLSEGVRARGAELCRLAVDTHQRIRAITRGTSPVEVRGNNFSASLLRLAETCSKAFQLRCFVEEMDEDAEMDSGLALELYLIAQEAILNAVRHGRPTEVGIQFSYRGGGALLSIFDDGSGFTGPGETGMGIRNMKARASRHGGSCQIGNRPEGGTEVRVTIPPRSVASQP